nr:hypothetical protein [Arthrospira sp. PLM2.Bin9]
MFPKTVGNAIAPQKTVGNAIALPTKNGGGERAGVYNWLVCSMADCCTRPYIGRVIRGRNWVKFGENAIALPTKTGAGKRLVGAGARSAIGKTSPLPAPALLLL